MNQPDLFAARRRGLDGARRAADHADRMREAWTATAVAWVRLFVSSRVGRPFLAEEVRAGALEWGLDAPPDGRAWGHVMRRAQRDGLIAAAGYAAAASSNGSPKVLWRKA
jgi:hypothetical protein